MTVPTRLRFVPDSPRTYHALAEGIEVEADREAAREAIRIGRFFDSLPEGSA